jgi:choline kinase
MKVVRRGGKVAEMAKTLPRWDAGYVGMTFVPGACAPLHRAAIARVIETKGEGVHVEAALVELAARGRPPDVADISGHGWLEIDEPHERAQAEAVLLRESWWA